MPSELALQPDHVYPVLEYSLAVRFFAVSYFIPSGCIVPDVLPFPSNEMVYEFGAYVSVTVMFSVTFVNGLSHPVLVYPVWFGADGAVAELP